MPRVSVIMPVYNASRYLRESIDSILSQSFDDFEFLIFNDGSVDDSAEIIRSYKDERIILQDFEFNQGYAKLLNLGFARSRGEFIARMDADDVAHPLRLEKQFYFLSNNPDHVVCGTNYMVIDGTESSNLPTDDEEIKLCMLSITPLCHPSVMIRTQTLRDHQLFYIPEHMPAEDHELWVRLSGYGRFHNLPEKLFYYRVHDNNISLKERTETQKQNLIDSQKNYIFEFFKEAGINEMEIELLHQLFFKESGYQLLELERIGRLVQQIILKNSTYPVPSRRVHHFLEEKFHYRCTTSTYLGLKAFIVANKFNIKGIPIMSNVKLLAKALIKYRSTSFQGPI